MTTCCMTGHRIIKTEHKDKLKPSLLNVISKLYDRGVKNFVVGGALGFDMLAERCIIEFRENHLDVRLIIYAPCKNQALKWSDEEKREYERLLSCADEVLYLTDTYYDGCMIDRNRRMVDMADVCIGYIYKQRSGAYSTMNYAKRQGLHVMNLVKNEFF